MKIEPGKSSREDVLRALGTPSVLATRDTFVCDWNQSYGYVVVWDTGGEITGKESGSTAIA